MFPYLDCRFERLALQVATSNTHLLHRTAISTPICKRPEEPSFAFNRRIQSTVGSGEEKSIGDRLGISAGIYSNQPNRAAPRTLAISARAALAAGLSRLSVDAIAAARSIAASSMNPARFAASGPNEDLISLR